MNWWYVLGGLVVVCVIGCLLDDGWFSAWMVVAIISGGLAIGVLLSSIVFSINAPNEIAVFVQQKEYVESHVAANEIEDAAITNKKIELNDWLFNAQYRNAKWGGWSFYSDDVQKLEPIE